MYKVRKDHDVISIKSTVESIAKRCLENYNLVAIAMGVELLDPEQDTSACTALLEVGIVINVLCDKETKSYHDLLWDDNEDECSEKTVVPCSKQSAVLRMLAHKPIIDEVLETSQVNPHEVTKIQVGLQ